MKMRSLSITMGERAAIALEIQAAELINVFVSSGGKNATLTVMRIHPLINAKTAKQPTYKANKMSFWVIALFDNGLTLAQLS